MVLKILVTILWCCMYVSAQLEPTESYKDTATLRSGDIKLYWKFNDTDITFEVHGKTEGWIGIGFSPNGAMTGADIIVGWVKDGITHVTDRHGVGNTFPPKDPEQNIHVLAGKECDGWTMFKFTRQLAACEADKDREITPSTQRLIYAHGATDPTGDDITSADYHGATNRGVESMYFLQPQSDSASPEENTEYYDVLNNNFHVPAKETYYNCRMQKLPTLPGKRHVIRIDPVITEGNELNVHHMIIFQCVDVLETDLEWLNIDVECYNPNMGPAGQCYTIIAATTIGGGSFEFPLEAGMSVGGVGDPMYIYSETHYDNPYKRDDIIDSSGLRFIYTSQLRKYDSGLAEISSFVSPLHHFIPPKAKSFSNVGFCPQWCFENKMDTAKLEKVNVFATVLHSHLAGRGLKLRHFRNNEELPYIAYDNAYDFNYQEARLVEPMVELVGATDHLRIECDYNTEDRTEMVEGGLSTNREMCVVFLYYYPTIDLSSCFSSPTRTESYSYFDIYNTTKVNQSMLGLYDTLDNYKVEAPSSPELVGKTVMEVMSSHNWTEENVDKFAEDVLDMKQLAYCDMAIRVQKVPKILSEHVPEVKQCSARDTSDQTTETETCDSASVLTSNLLLLVVVQVLIKIFRA